MITVETNAPEVLRTLDGFQRQVPFASAQTLNKTAVSVQKHLREVTYPRAGFQRRNKSLPKALTMFRNVDRANKRKLHAKVGPTMGRGGHVAGSGFTGRQRTGDQKRAKGSAIAIPQIGPGLRRLKSGSISKKKKPRANPKLFKIKARGGREVLVERQRKKLVTRYVLTPVAKGTRKLSRFEKDVEMVVKRDVGFHFTRSMIAALNTAKRK